MEDIKRFMQIYHHQDLAIKKDLLNMQIIIEDTTKAGEFGISSFSNHIFLKILIFIRSL